MGIFDRFSRKKPEIIEQKPEERSLWTPGGMFGLSSYSTNKAMNLSSVYCAVQQISDSVASLPINIVSYENGIKRRINSPLENVLNVSPNPLHTRFTMMKMLVESVYLKGNGYLYIDRDEHMNTRQLILVNPDFVQPMLQKDGTVKYLVSGMQSAVDAENMVHLYLHVDEMHNGISTIKYAAKSLEGIEAAEKQAANFFKSGGNLSGIIKPTANWNQEQKQQALTSFASSIGGDKVGIAMLPPGWDFQTVSVNPEDAELLSSRQWSIYEIARWFKIPVTKLMVYDNVSYNGLEMAQLAYLSDTILPLCNMIELEMNKKIFKPSQIGKIQVDFNYDALLETDKKSQAEYFRQMISNGVLTINQARNALGYEPETGKGCDTHFIQLSYASADDIAAGLYIKQNAQDQSGDVINDNKLGNNEEDNSQNANKKSTSKNKKAK